VINDGVGDSGAIVGANGAGLVLTALNDDAFVASMPQLRALLADPLARERCRKVAIELFDINRGAERYGALYRRLADGAGSRPLEEPAPI
jgi:hypothetical protein